jgi:hypothetical protein
MSGLSNKDQTLGGILILATSFYTLISKFLILTTPMPDHYGDGKSFKFSEMMSWFLVLG